jgi:hypothetical protein
LGIIFDNFSTPLDHQVRIQKISDSDVPADLKIFQKVIGILNFLSCSTRLDISTAVNLCARHLQSPSQIHLNCAFRILGYLKFHSDYVIQ